MEANRKAIRQENVKFGRRVKMLTKYISDGPIQEDYLDKVEDLLEDVAQVHEFIDIVLREALKLANKEPRTEDCIREEISQNEKRLYQAQELADSANKIYLANRSRSVAVHGN